MNAYELYDILMALIPDDTLIVFLNKAYASIPEEKRREVDGTILFDKAVEIEKAADKKAKEADSGGGFGGGDDVGGDAGDLGI